MEVETGTQAPISGELWARLKRLDPRCEMFMARETQWQVAGSGGRMVWSGVGGPPSATRRVWRVRLYPKGSIAVHDYVDRHGPTLSDAILAAVEEGERRGWHRQ